MSSCFKNKGFALLYAVLLSGAVLTVGIILMNIITKQLVFSSFNRESETTYYYLANSGRECLLNYASNGQGVFYEITATDDASGHPIETITFNQTANIQCSLSGGNIVLNIVNSASAPYPEYKAAGIIIDDNGVTRKLDLLVRFNRECILTGVCDGTDLLSKSVAFLVSDGYSGSSGERIVKRSAPSIIKPY
ncbi:MAG: hypothetical protein WC385_02350 [Candidatus Paceibacterota bacterium]|jgi:hypothetical protein